MLYDLFVIHYSTGSGLAHTQEPVNGKWQIAKGADDADRRSTSPSII
jgi:hypothetical protein